MQSAMKAQEKARAAEERTMQLSATARAEREYEAAVAAALASARPANVGMNLWLLMASRQICCDERPCKLRHAAYH